MNHVFGTRGRLLPGLFVTWFQAGAKGQTKAAQILDVPQKGPT